VLPLHEIKRGIARWPQDFLAPFYMFTRIEYRSGILPNTDALRAASAELNAQVVYRRGPFSKTEWTFGMKIEEKMLVSFSFRNRTVSQTIAVSVS
jgi:hypothetical protein